MPASWQWTQVYDISSSILYGVSESAKPQGEYKLLRITDIQNNSVNWRDVPYTDFDKTKAPQYILRNGDIVFARTGATVGKSYLVKDIPVNTIYASYLIRIQTSEEILPEYLKIFFESSFYWQQIFEGAVGIGQPNVNGTSLGLLWLPIPPRNEQLRIFSATQDFTSIISSIVHSRIAINESITQTKSKILELAMQGKLVPQDPTDEPAAEMLKRINPNAKILTDSQQCRNLPEGWCHTTLKSIGKWQAGATPSKLNPAYYGKG
ncbi:MAG: restriction endonuclease subunit S, partial [Bacteroides sp.]|nr:restriction endonuclease subunit S [Bacteroides sp.]